MARSNRGVHATRECVVRGPGRIRTGPDGVEGTVGDGSVHVGHGSHESGERVAHESSGGNEFSIGRHGSLRSG